MEVDWVFQDDSCTIGRITRTSFPITATERAARLEWATNNLSTTCAQWATCLWSGNFAFIMNIIPDQTQGHFRDDRVIERDLPPLQQSALSISRAGGIRFWCCFIWDKMGPIRILGNDRDRDVERISEDLLSFIDDMVPHDFIRTTKDITLMVDDDLLNESQDVLDYLAIKDKELQGTLLPPKSRDLNPIQDLVCRSFQMRFKRVFQQLCESNEGGFTGSADDLAEKCGEIVRSVWAELRQQRDVSGNLIRSMPGRGLTVVRTLGA